jgi:hypothetical protein
MPVQLPYEVKVFISDVEFNRNIEDHSLPIDAINIRIMSGIIELKSPAIRAQEKLEENQERNKRQENKEEISSIESSLNQKTPSAHRISLEPSTSQRAPNNEDPSTSNCPSTVSIESNDPSMEESDSQKSNLSISEEDTTSQKTNDDRKTSKLQNIPEVGSVVRFTEPKQKYSKISLISQAERKTTLGVSEIIPKHPSTASIKERNIRDFGSGGFSLTSTPETLADWLERKPFRYEIVKDGEVLGELKKFKQFLISN